MDNIMDSAKDVVLLSTNGIIQNAINRDNVVAQLLNSISKDVILEPDRALDDVHQQVNTYCRMPWNLWRTDLIHLFLEPSSLLSCSSS
nr:unnamed protein product [Digitaria exilis]